MEGAEGWGGSGVGGGEGVGARARRGVGAAGGWAVRPPPQLGELVDGARVERRASPHAADLPNRVLVERPAAGEVPVPLSRCGRRGLWGGTGEAGGAGGAGRGLP